MVWVLAHRDRFTSGFIWSKDPKYAYFLRTFGEKDEDGRVIVTPDENEANFWMFVNNSTDFVGNWAGAYGGFLSFDLISLSEDPLIGQRFPLAEIRVKGWNER